MSDSGRLVWVIHFTVQVTGSNPVGCRFSLMRGA